MREPLYPSLYQINTRVWLTELSQTLGRPAILDDIPDASTSGPVGTPRAPHDGVGALATIATEPSWCREGNISTYLGLQRLEVTTP
jgi:hypothetical protein